MLPQAVVIEWMGGAYLSPGLSEEGDEGADEVGAG